MAATLSNMIPLGSVASEFNLLNPITGNYQSLSDFKSPIATVIAFICNHCPYVIHINPKFVEIAGVYSAKGISFIGINSNDAVKYPADSPEKMIIHVKEAGYNFPYLYDETQEVAKSYSAACTPDIYVFDKDLQLVYRGQFDSSRPGNNIPVTGEDLSNALDLLIEGKKVPENQIPSIGCNIKWK
jgi:thiol-disulfide isomerase/thioredoxin